MGTYKNYSSIIRQQKQIKPKTMTTHDYELGYKQKLALLNKETRFKLLYAVDSNGIQWGAFRYKKDATQFAKNINGTIIKRKLLTNQF
jgi:hypothetical protein